MSFFDDIGLRAAESLEQSVGPYVALASYKRLFAGPPDVRAKAAHGALRCAVALDDEREVVDLCSVWRTAREAEDSALPFARDLLRRQKPKLAMMLASAEEERSGAPRASYLRLVAEGQLGGPTTAWTIEAWRRVVAAAGSDGALLTHATARLLAALFEHASHDSTFVLSRAEIASLGESAPIDLALPVERLVILRARLHSTNRFHRASALSLLEELARRSDGPLRAEAVLVAARHLGALFARLDAVEIDRIAATIKHWPDERTRALVLAQLPAWVRVIAAIKAGANADRLAQALDDLASRSAEMARGLAVARAPEDAEPASRPLGSSAEEALAWIGVDANKALGRGDMGDVERLLLLAARRLASDTALPPALWLAAIRSLVRGSGPARRAAGALVDQALARTASMPPRPLVEIAGLLSAAGLSDASARALAEAGRWKEPGAGALLAGETRRGAYAALARGDRARALELLSQARAWLEGSGPA